MLLHEWIIGTLSKESLGLVVGLDTFYQVWHSLQETYAQDSQEMEFQHTQQLTYMRKEELVSLLVHLKNFKSICDNLAGIG